MGCATLQDQFEPVFGKKRGASRALPHDPVSLAYSALSAEDLDHCLTLKLTPHEKALVTAAKVEREALEFLNSTVFYSLAAQADLCSAAPVHLWPALAARLRTCALAGAHEEHLDNSPAPFEADDLRYLSTDGREGLNQLLDDCLTLELAPDEDALVAAAKADHESVKLLTPNVFHLLATQADLRSKAPKLMWVALATRLRACGKARLSRDADVLAAGGARSFGMFSVEGNIALSKIVDEVISSRYMVMSHARVVAISCAGKIRRLGMTHREVSDRVVQENVTVVLLSHGISRVIVDELLQAPR